MDTVQPSAYATATADFGSTARPDYTYDYLGQWFSNVGGELDYQRDLQMQAIDQRFNSQENSIARQWQEYMSNTAYQRAADDMRAAGLNPALAYSQGGADYGSVSPASSHSGRTSRGSGNAMGLLGKIIGGAFGVAISALNSNSREEIAEARIQAQKDIALNRTNSAYDLQQARFNHYRYNDYDYYKNQKGKKYHSFDQHNVTEGDLYDLYTNLDRIQI